MVNTSNKFISTKSPNLLGALSSEFRDDLLDSESRLPDDVMQSATRQGLAAVHRNADGSNGRAVVKQDVMTSANAVDLEAKPHQGANGLLSGYRRQSLRAHGQAAMVR